MPVEGQTPTAADGPEPLILHDAMKGHMGLEAKLPDLGEEGRISISQSKMPGIPLQRTSALFSEKL